MIRVREEIFAQMPTMAPAERKVARTLLEDYPRMGLVSANALARAAGTSAPTVLRLVARLGLESYTQFQAHLHAEIQHDLNSPVRRAEAQQRREGSVADPTLFETSVETRRALVDRLAQTVNETQFAEAVRLLASEPPSVLVAGGYYSRFIAEIMARQLDQIIPHVDFLADPLGYDIGKFYAARKRSVVVLFDLRRYQRSGQQIAELAKREKASLLLVTDQDLSPCVQLADAVLVVPVDGIPFDSFAGLVVLVESLVEGVFHAAGERAVERMKLWESRSKIERTTASDPKDGEEA